MIDTLSRQSLVNVADLDNETLPAVFKRYRPAIDQVLRWSREYLSSPHPELGRKGPVCPFVAKALEKNLYFLSVYDKTRIEPEEVKELLLGFRDRFLEIEPRDGYDAIFKCILVLFPNLPIEDAPRIIDATQVDLIEQFTPFKTMIGEFHPGPPNKPGLWNQNFKPLFCPVPMLVIRHMVNTDILFLRGNRTNTMNYLKFFGNDVPKRFVHYANQAIDAFGIDHPHIREENEPVGV